MYYEEDERFYNPDLIQVVRHELYAVNSSLESSPFGLKYVPTHTEDGIPIRKLYVSNLPPNTTRAELHGVFAKYGFIKSCWLRMGDKGPHRAPKPTYAFVTYSNSSDAINALQAPIHEKILRGRNLRIFPADSWHQPVEESDSQHRSQRGQLPLTCRTVTTRLGDLITVERSSNIDSLATTSGRYAANNVNITVKRKKNLEELASLNIDQYGFEYSPEEFLELRSSSKHGSGSIVCPFELFPERATGLPDHINILDILNTDCLKHILDYIPIRDLVRSETVSKTWQSMIQEYLDGIREYKTSSWQHEPVMMTTAVLRRVLQRVGGSLTRLHIDHHWSALNDRTAHSVGKFCPNLEELKIVGMHTKNWNPLSYGCKKLKRVSFVSCNKLNDASLVHLVKDGSTITNLSVANNTHVTGIFLTGSGPLALSSVAFYNCYSLQGTVLSAAIANLPLLTSLKIDVGPHTMWKIVPMILKKLPQLEELSLSQYISVIIPMTPQCNDEFCEALATLTELKILNLSRNIYITNDLVKRVAQCCKKLESLDISGCNSRCIIAHPGVGNEGVTAVCRGCKSLSSLDLSYLGSMTDAGMRAVAGLPLLKQLTARGIATISAAPLVAVLAACPLLVDIDLSGCDGISDEVVVAAVRALETRPRQLTLRVAGTAAAKGMQPEIISHRLLIVDIYDDRSNPHLRPDFVDRIFEDSSDDSLGDIYDHEDFDDFFGADAQFMEDELENLEGLYQYGFDAPDILIL